VNTFGSELHGEPMRVRATRSPLPMTMLYYDPSRKKEGICIKPRAPSQPFRLNGNWPLARQIEDGLNSSWDSGMKGMVLQGTYRAGSSTLRQRTVLDSSRLRCDKLDHVILPIVFFLC
jgi:hypothetical protein